MKANSPAQQLLLQMPAQAPVSLSAELLTVARAPVLFQKGLLFFAHEQGSIWNGPYKEPHMTASILEANSSHIHLDAFDSMRSELEALQKAFLYVDALVENIRQVTSLPITVVVSTQGEPYIGAVVRFHITRPLERWVSENLEGYVEPVLVFEF